MFKVEDIIIIALIATALVMVYRKYRLIDLPSNLNMGQKLVLSLASIFFIYLAYKTKVGLKGYIIASLLAIFLNIYSRAEGISKEGVIFSRGRGVNNIILVKYEELRVIKLKIRDNIRLEAQGPKGLAVMYFKKDDLNKIESLIGEVKVKLQ